MSEHSTTSAAWMLLLRSCAMRWTMRSQPLRSTCTSMPGCAVSKALAIFSAVCSSIEVYQTTLPSSFALASSSGVVAVGAGAAAGAVPAVASSSRDQRRRRPRSSVDCIETLRPQWKMVHPWGLSVPARGSVPAESAGAPCRRPGHRPAAARSRAPAGRRASRRDSRDTSRDRIAARPGPIGFVRRSLGRVARTGSRHSGVSAMSCSRTDTAVSPLAGRLAGAAAQHHRAAIDDAVAEMPAAEDVGAADKAGDEFRARPLIDVLRRADLLDPAAIHRRRSYPPSSSPRPGRA